MVNAIWRFEKFLREKIEDEYGAIFTAEQKKRILGYKFRDWGRLSKEFLTLEGADKESEKFKALFQDYGMKIII